MADLQSATITADVVPKPSDQEDHRQPTNPIFSFYSNFLKLFNFPPPPERRQPEESAALEPTKTDPVVGEFAKASEIKPTVVTFPRPTEETLLSLKLEPDEVEERNTNPVVLWQVYAIGGFLVLRWAWTRWNERRGRKKPSDEDPPPALE